MRAVPQNTRSTQSSFITGEQTRTISVASPVAYTPACGFTLTLSVIAWHNAFCSYTPTRAAALYVTFLNSTSRILTIRCSFLFAFGCDCCFYASCVCVSVPCKSLFLWLLRRMNLRFWKTWLTLHEQDNARATFAGFLDFNLDMSGPR